MAKIGLVLAGCGAMDGSEIREAVLTVLALSELKQEFVFIAPNKDQHHVINHLTGEEIKQTRNIMQEASRIARGPVLDLADANPNDFAAVILPGGYGAAKNLTNYAFKAENAEIIPELKQFLSNFYQLDRPIGAICIAPTTLALLTKFIGHQSKPKLTIGNDKGTAEIIEKLGCLHVECQANEICYDEANKFISTPAYMYAEANLFDIYQGIRKLVNKVCELIA